jgi:hypothetical protein
MSIVINNLPKLRSVEFLNSTIMFVHLDNDRTFLVPLEKFPAIKSLTTEQRKDFEIIDNEQLSFLSIDEVYSVEELLGLS